MISLFLPEINLKSIQNIKDAVEKKQINNGFFLDQISGKFSNTLNLKGQPYFVNSGTAGLHVALESIGVEGSKVIVPTQSFMATALAIKYARGTPTFCDIDPKTGNIDINKLAELLDQDGISAIVGVHWGGNPCDIDAIEGLAKKYNVPTIYDCAHGLSSKYKGDSVLNYGNYAVCSFQAIKEITCGDGGVVVVNQSRGKDISEYTWFGMGRKNGRELTYYNHVGYKYRMNNLNAAIIYSEIDYIQERMERRSKIANMYSAIVKNHALRIEYQSSYWLYSLFVNKLDVFINYMNKNNIEASSVDRPMIRNPLFNENIENYPGSTIFERRHVAIPCRSNMTEEEILHVVEILNKYNFDE